MRSWTLIVFGILVSVLVVTGLIYSKNLSQTKPEALSNINSTVASDTTTTAPPANPTSSGTPKPQTEASPGELTTNLKPDLTVDPNTGLSKAVVVMKTTKGTIKFRFYSQDAPKTVARMVELINKGFYNGLAFHRVIEGFVIQGGDPLGNGTGGSGQKLPAEFNSRRHVEGAVAMARAGDPNSADSQFYISLGVHPHLDHNYTVFGQVEEGMDVAKRIQVGDKMTSVIVQ